MIPVYLKISGIYSYREPQEIDFQTLTSSHIFGIFGAVGSGKSALLEAIVFALFGETERLNSRDQRSYNMMNLKSNEAFIQFDFQAPSDKGLYRAIARGKRNSRNKEDVKFDRSIFRIENGNVIPVETGQIETIIGISYDNFRRTIIIPQGRFQEFLQLGAKDRTDMIKELFSLQKFDLAFKTSSLQRLNDESLNNCIGRIQQLGDISPEQIEEKKKAIKALSEQIKGIQATLSEKEKIEAALLLLKKATEELRINRQKYSELDQNQSEINLAEQRLNDYDECVSNFKSDFGLLDDQKKRLADEVSLHAAMQEELEKVNSRLREVKSNYEVSKKTFESRETLRRQAEDLEICAKVNNRIRKAEEIEGRIRNGEIQVSEATKNLESLKVQIKLTATTRETLKGELPERKNLQEAQDWYGRKDQLEEKIRLQREQENKIDEEISVSRKELAGVCEQLNLRREEAGVDFQALPGMLGLKREDVSKLLTEVSSKWFHLKVQDQLKTFASELHEGEECPLCGSTHHPHIIEVGELAQELGRLNEEKNKIEILINSIDAALVQVKLIIDRLTNKLKEKEELKPARQESESISLAHQKLFAWGDLTSDSIRDLWQKYDKIQEELEKLTVDEKEISVKADDESEKIGKYGKALENLRVEHSRALQDASTLLTQLSILNHADFESVTEEAILIQASELRKQYESIEEKFRADEKLFQELNSAGLSLDAKINLSDKGIQQLKLQIENNSKQLEARILSSRFVSESIIRNILNSNIERQKELQRIRQHYDSKASLGSIISELEKQVNNLVYDAVYHEKLKLEIEDLKSSLEKVNQQFGATDKELARLSNDLNEVAKLTAEKNRLEIRRDNLKTFSGLFYKQGFVNFVSTIYLQNLVDAANERFYKLTRQQLKLELDEENNFRIVDYLNVGQWRSVKTLSGGQTFQASLCLALALADNIHQLNLGGQNFFFLDEGFGTLDRESLEQVFETLKALQKENRIVGVISHVEDLQQEIGAWLKITRDDERGSLISTSWS